MADTVRTLAALQALLADNTTGDISAQDIRDFLVSAYHIVQVAQTQTSAVNSGSTQIPADDTIPQNSEGIELMTLAITPISATNLLRIQALVMLASGTASRYATVALFQDATANALAATIELITSVNGMSMITIDFTMVAGTVSATTFKIRAGLHSTGTMTFNGVAAARLFGGVANSSITITELVA